MASSGSRELTDDEVESLLFDEETLAELGYARQATADWMTATWVSYQADEELDEAQIKWVDGILKGTDALRKGSFRKGNCKWNHVTNINSGEHVGIDNEATLAFYKYLLQ